MNSPINVRSLAHLERDFERILRSLGAGRDLTTRQLQSLCILGKASVEDDPLSAEDLRRFMHLTPAEARQTVRRLLDVGLLEQRRSDHDARVKHLILSDEGRQALQRLVTYE